jgi:hypothetical protein
MRNIERVGLEEDEIGALTDRDSSLILKEVAIGRIRSDERKHFFQGPVAVVVELLDAL